MFLEAGFWCTVIKLIESGNLRQVHNFGPAPRECVMWKDKELCARQDHWQVVGWHLPLINQISHARYFSALSSSCEVPINHMMC